MPNINVDHEVYYQIKKRADLAVDTPNTVLRSVFELGLSRERAGPPEHDPDNSEWAGSKTVDTHSQPPGTRPTLRARTEDIISVYDYSYPIIDSLSEMGGEGERDAVLEAVRWKIEPIIKPPDLEPMTSGNARWWTRAVRCKSDLLAGDVLQRQAPIGYWRLSARGWRIARREEDYPLGRLNKLPNGVVPPG